MSYAEQGKKTANRIQPGILYNMLTHLLPGYSEVYTSNLNNRCDADYIGFADNSYLRRELGDWETS